MTRPLGDPLQGHTGRVAAVAVAQVEGRPVAVTGHLDGAVRLWDLSARRPLGNPIQGRHAGEMEAVAVAQVEGRTVAVTGHLDGAVRLWDLADRRPLGNPLQGHTPQEGLVLLRPRLASHP